MPAAGFSHADTGAANCYLDRNRAVRTLAPVAKGAALTVDFRLLSAATIPSVPTADLQSVLDSVPILYDEVIRATLGLPA